MRVVLARDAQADLSEIAAYVAQEDRRSAVRLVLELDAKARQLGEFPNRFHLVPELADLGIRRRVHGSYLIFYRVEAERVLVLRYLHGSREYLPLLDPGN